jgi:sec-independent protein translocase protein TatB
MLLFFDFGTGEIVLILLVLFVVLGPKQLPEVARSLGKTINEMKRASAGFKNEINKEIQRIDRETQISEVLKEKKPAAAEPEKPVGQSHTIAQGDITPEQATETKQPIQ